MPFSGPGGNYGAITRDRYQRVLEMAQDSEDGFYTGRPRAASGGVARLDTSLLEREDAREAERARLTVTPGVRRGGSTATRPQVDSPLNVGSSRRFERFGDTYSFDPVEAGEERGEASAAAEGSADKARYDNLVRMPGFTPRQAARIVYGRGDAFDQDAANAALAQYVRQPSRETAATAIERGASPYSTPFTGGFDPDAKRVRPGTEEAMEMRMREFEERQRIQEERARREIELRAQVRPEPRDRMALRTNKDGSVEIINIDDPTVGPRASGVVTAKPGRAPSAMDTYLKNQGKSDSTVVKPVTPTAATDAHDPEVVAAGFVNVQQKPETAETIQIERSRFAQRLQALKAAGRTREEAAVIMGREGWDPMTGRRKR